MSSAAFRFWRSLFVWGPASLAWVTGSAAATTTCAVKSGPRAPAVVELYTSQGCNSCPPAEQWISRVSTDAQVVALAFHVSYWDNLGWPDPFASPENTQRQQVQRRVNGAQQSYTPQVVINGRDRPDWRNRPVRDAVSEQPLAPVSVTLLKEHDVYRAQITLSGATPDVRLEALWAVTESGHRTAVAAGENRGRTLTQDAVVREWRAVPPWLARKADPTALAFTPTHTTAAPHTRTLNLVIVNADTGQPVQAVQLGC